MWVDLRDITASHHQPAPGLDSDHPRTATPVRTPELSLTPCVGPSATLPHVWSCSRNKGRKVFLMEESVLSYWWGLSFRRHSST